VQLLAISTDPSADSALFARKYGIEFPLLSDEAGAVSRQYVGVNYDDTTIPGIVIVRKDGAIVYRQVASTKDDRLSSEQLLATIDRTLGTTGEAATHGYAAYERVQIHLDLGGGVRHDRDAGTSGKAMQSLAALFPIGRQLLIGPWVESQVTAVTGVDLAVVGRLPLLHDTGAIHITTTMGWSPTSDADWNVGLRVGPWIALTPTWALHLDLGGVLRGFAEREAFATFGLTYLLGPRARSKLLAP
jgi:hypothetical protein